MSLASLNTVPSIAAVDLLRWLNGSAAVLFEAVLRRGRLIRTRKRLAELTAEQLDDIGVADATIIGARTTYDAGVALIANLSSMR